MNTTLKTFAVWIIALSVLMALAVACSDDPPPPDATPTEPPEVEILQSDQKLITIALSPYGSSVSDVDLSILLLWCVHPDAKSAAVPPQGRKSPPVPTYLPEGVSFDKEVHLNGKHMGNIYTGSLSQGNDVRISVSYGGCLLTNRSPDLLEQVNVAGNWGVLANNMKDTFATLTLYVETDLGYVEIRLIDTQNKETVGKDELIKIAESMPIFGPDAASTAP